VRQCVEAFTGVAIGIDTGEATGAAPMGVPTLAPAMEPSGKLKPGMKSIWGCGLTIAIGGDGEAYGAGPEAAPEAIILLAQTRSNNSDGTE